jgi:glycerol uptake facilitator-like aquaporin
MPGFTNAFGRPRRPERKGELMIPLTRRMATEGLGTFWLVFGGCGSAVLAAAFPNVGIGLLGVALAFGLTVLTMAYAIGHVSGCHLNPAVSIGLWAGKRFPARELLPYIVAQVIGGIVGGRRAAGDRQWQARIRPRRRPGGERLR